MGCCITTDRELSEDAVNVIGDLKEEFVDAVNNVLDIEDEFEQEVNELAQAEVNAAMHEQAATLTPEDVPDEVDLWDNRF